MPQFSFALLFFDAVMVHLAASTSTILVLFGFYAFAGRHVGTPVLQSIVVQASPLVFFTCRLVISHGN